MRCSEITPVLELYVDQELEPSLCSSIADHLAHCESCSESWAEIKQFCKRTNHFISSISVPSDLVQSIKRGLADSLNCVEGCETRQAADCATSEEGSPVSEQRPTERSTLRPRTVLCERHELIRFGLKRVLAEALSVIGEASDGIGAIEISRRMKPDLLVIDVDLDGLNGVEICRRVNTELPDTNVLVLTDSYSATKYHYQLIRAGARGLCLKSSGPRTLFEAIDQVTHGLPYCDPKITLLIKQKPTSTLPNTNLTDREIEVLLRLDLRNKEISEELDMKLRTVEKHIESILSKLKVPTRTAAALKAVQLGYVLLPKMPGRDPLTGTSYEQIANELQAELAIAHEHLKALVRQNESLRQATDRKRSEKTS